MTSVDDHILSTMTHDELSSYMEGTMKTSVELTPQEISLIRSTFMFRARGLNAEEPAYVQLLDLVDKLFPYVKDYEDIHRCASRQGWELLYYVPVAGDDIQAPGAYTVCQVSDEAFATHFWNSQDKGFHGGHYTYTLVNAYRNLNERRG